MNFLVRLMYVTFLVLVVYSCMPKAVWNWHVPESKPKPIVLEPDMKDEPVVKQTKTSCIASKGFEARDKYLDAARKRENITIAKLLTNRQAFVLQAGTKVQVLFMGTEHARIRVLDEHLNGEELIVSPMFLE